MGWNDRPYPLLPLSDSQSFANAITNTEHLSVAFALQERESYPFATRLIGRPHLAYLR